MLRINFWDFYWAAGERVEENRKKKKTHHIFFWALPEQEALSAIENTCEYPKNSVHEKKLNTTTLEEPWAAL